MENKQDKSLFEQWVRGLGFKDILLVIMGLMVAFIFIFNGSFNSNTGYTKDHVKQLELLFQRRIDDLENENTILMDSIVVYKDRGDEFLKSANDRQNIIDDLEDKQRKQQRVIDDLIKKRKEVREEIKNLDDEELEGWWVKYFNSKEKKQ